MVFIVGIRLVWSFSFSFSPLPTIIFFFLFPIITSSAFTRHFFLQQETRDRNYRYFFATSESFRFKRKKKNIFQFPLQFSSHILDFPVLCCLLSKKTNKRDIYIEKRRWKLTSYVHFSLFDNDQIKGLRKKFLWLLLSFSMIEEFRAS